MYSPTSVPSTNHGSRLEKVLFCTTPAPVPGEMLLASPSIVTASVHLSPLPNVSTAPLQRFLSENSCFVHQCPLFAFSDLVPLGKSAIRIDWTRRTRQSLGLGRILGRTDDVTGCDFHDVHQARQMVVNAGFIPRHPVCRAKSLIALEHPEMLVRCKLMQEKSVRYLVARRLVHNTMPAVAIQWDVFVAISQQTLKVHGSCVVFPSAPSRGAPRGVGASIGDSSKLECGSVGSGV
jgi:hypothetical protein